VRAGKVGSRQTPRNHDWTPDTQDAPDGAALAASKKDQAAREKDARIVAVRLRLRLGHDPAAHREIAAMLEVSA
jgi:hypothetical protein